MGPAEMLRVALGERTNNRLDILLLIQNAPEEGIKSLDIAEVLGFSGPSTSQHLKALAQAGIVVGRRDGNKRWYTMSTDFPHRNLLISVLNAER